MLARANDYVAWYECQSLSPGGHVVQGKAEGWAIQVLLMVGPEICSNHLEPPPRFSPKEANRDDVGG